MTSVNSKIFRAYDIRGVYPEEINEKSAYQIGQAFAIYLKKFEKEIPEKVAVGYDARLSSPILLRSFINGVIGEGVNVWNIGLATVDEVYFASGHFNIPAVMITASHNPKEWNGFKLMKSSVDFFDVKELEVILNSSESKKNIFQKIGGVTKKDIKEYYINHVLNFINIGTIRPMRVVIDASNGTVGPILKSILQKLPIEYTAMNFNLDGDFPHHDPDPTKEKNLTDLREKVKSNHYHFGCAFDGDGDRIIFTDENGDPISSSIIAALMSRYFLLGKHGEKIVYCTTISRIVPEVIQIYNGKAVIERVGHTFISNRLKEIDGIFGAEKSGHYFFKEFFYADSGIISFLIMLNILSNEKKSLSSLVKEFSKYISTEEINFKIKNPYDLIKKIAQHFEGYQVDWLDGLTVTTPDFWLNIRESNTELLLRLNIEARDEIILSRVKKNLIALIKNI